MPGAPWHHMTNEKFFSGHIDFSKCGESEKGMSVNMSNRYIHACIYLSNARERFVRKVGRSEKGERKGERSIA